MKLLINRAIVKIESHEAEDNFLIVNRVVERTRKNQRSTSFHKCDLCLQLIDKDGEEYVVAMAEDHTMFYVFHKACFNISLRKGV